MVNQSIVNIRTIPGVPVGNERQTPDFKTVQVDGSCLIVSLQGYSYLPRGTSHAFIEEGLPSRHTLLLAEWFSTISL
jgi:hypothetical protein